MDPIVRPLVASDSLTTLWPDPEHADHQRARAAADEHPLLAIAALAGEVVVGLILGDFVGGGYRIVEAHGRALPDILAYVRASFAGQRLEAMAPVPVDTQLEAQLTTAGFTLIDERIHFERALDAPRLVADPFTYRTYAEVGRAALEGALARIIPLPELERAAITVSQCVDGWLRRASIGPRGLDTSLWRLGHVDDALAGVALAQLDYPEAGTGSLLYVGVVPERRRGGLGAILHEHALETLRQGGMTRYLDATSVDNPAMRRIMAAAGCAPCGGSRRFIVRRPPALSRVTSFADLVAHLRAQEYAVELRDPTGWARAPMRFVEHEAVIDVVWLDDARVVQVIHTFDLVVPVDAVERILRACGTVNGSLDVPGFIMDEVSRTLRYQLPLLLEADGLSIAQLCRALSVAVATVSNSAHWWHGVAQSDRVPRDWTSPWAG